MSSTLARLAARRLRRGRSGSCGWRRSTGAMACGCDSVTARAKMSACRSSWRAVARVRAARRASLVRFTVTRDPSAAAMIPQMLDSTRIAGRWSQRPCRSRSPRCARRLRPRAADAGRSAASIWRAPAIASPATRRNGGAPFAGGLRLDTPFGYMLSPNITPDPDDRHRALVERRLLPRAARRREQARPGHVPDDALRLLHQGRRARTSTRSTRTCARSSRCATRSTSTTSTSRSTSAGRWPRGASSTSGRAPTSPDPAKSASWNRGALPGRGPRPLQRLPFAAQPPGRHREEQAISTARSSTAGSRST